MGTEEPPRERWIGPKKKGTNDKVQEERERERTRDVGGGPRYLT